MSASVTREISPTVRSIASCQNFHDSADYILTPMMDTLRSSYGVVFVFDSSGPGIASVERMIFIGPRRAAEMYRNDHFRADPMRAYPENIPVRLSDCLRAVSDDEGFKQYVSRCLIGNGIGPCIGVRLCVRIAEGFKEIAVVFQRKATDVDYDDRDLQKFHDLVPILRLAISNIILIEELITQNSAGQPLSKTPLLKSSSVHEQKPTADIYYSPHYRQRMESIPEIYNNVRNYTDVKYCALPEFTDREWEVIWALGEGHSNSSMSLALGISIRTVENHLRSIYHKANVNSRTQLIAKVRLADTRPRPMIHVSSGKENRIH